MTQKGLGFRFSEDPGDNNYPMTTRLAPEPEAALPAIKYHRGGVRRLDQGQEGKCVLYAWAHFLECSPLRTKVDMPTWADTGYVRAQGIDEFMDTPPEEGTSIRAGAKVMQERGHISTYLWGQTVDVVDRWVRQNGPVVIGSPWHEGMARPDSEGFVNLTGSVLGGHAWLIRGSNSKRGVFRCRNSWGADWGDRGEFWITFEDLDTLLQRNAHACTTLETALITGGTL